MKSFAFAAIAGLTQATVMSELEFEFMNFIVAHNKNYNTLEEFTARFTNFVKQDIHIARQNAKETGHTAGHNYLSDWSAEEYSSMMGLNAEDREQDQENIFIATPNSTGIDWRTVKGVVTPVKDQGQCGSCWAFSATESVESHYVIAGNDQVIMAPQELVDCSKGLFSNHGCSGGWYYYAWKWLETSKSMLESDYPYTSGVDGKETKCAYDSSKGVTNVKSYQQVGKDTDSIKAAIEIGPVSVAVNADNDAFRNYKSGIVTADDGCPSQVDHAIQAVGWGSEDGQDYYIVRNSWASTWGDAGFIKIATGSGAGVCGINQDVYYPLI